MKRSQRNIIIFLLMMVSIFSFSWYSIAKLKKADDKNALVSNIPQIGVPKPRDELSVKGKNPTERNESQHGDKKENKDKGKKKTEKQDKKENNKGKNEKSKDNKSNNDKTENTSNDKNDEDGGFKEDPADIFVQETIRVGSLLEEIGIKDKDRILYVKCVTGVGQDTAVEAINGIYSLLLSTTGTTLVQIKYIDDDGNSQVYVKKINYVRPEGTTPKGKEPLIHTNLKDMGVYNNPIINFDLWLTDYRGKPLAYNNAQVEVNGTPANYVGEMERQTYRITLKSGSNTIEIKIKDKYQYTVKKTYTVYYKSGSGKVIMSLEGGTVGKKYFIAPTEVSVEPGTPLSYVLIDFLEKHGYTCSYAGSPDEGFYLARVIKKDMLKGYKIPQDLKEYIIRDTLIFDETKYENIDSLGEFDFCQGSGWMYSINGLYSSYGFDKAFVQDKDVVRIRFTLAYGKDISGYAVTSGIYGKLKQYDKDW